MAAIPLYQAIARAIVSYQNSIEAGNIEWRDRHEERAHKLVKDHMPSGSGFDHGTTLDLGESSDKRLVFYTGFHHMNENGFYDGWTEHTVYVKPSLSFDFDLRVTGRNRNDIKEYIADTFHHILANTVEEFPAAAAAAKVEESSNA
jgi:hypothetical protein